MWRYMESPASFTSDTWFCRRCVNQTRRRLHPNDLQHVPVDDRPHSWGHQSQWFAAIRAERLRSTNRVIPNAGTHTGNFDCCFKTYSFKAFVRYSSEKFGRQCICYFIPCVLFVCGAESFGLSLLG